MPSMSIRKNDQVIVRTGKDRGKKGRVLMVIAARLWFRLPSVGACYSKRSSTHAGPKCIRR